ncbi:2-hydroxyacyl-CoA dehydratase [Frateuria sp. GZRR33]|uniref:2-hydroxyacyl-CoA dehydratase n=1 Tax=Frateuria sp. GZRR33 TaxID=3351535 RepID=UPI003EDB7F9A
MTVPTDAFRRFQAELAALESNSRSPKTHMEQAKEEFLALRKRYGLTVADVVTFFPEEEGIAYLQQLIAARTR